MIWKHIVWAVAATVIAFMVVLDRRHDADRRFNILDRMHEQSSAALNPALRKQTLSRKPGFDTHTD